MSSNLAISGIGLVSPFGTDVADTWRRVQIGERPPIGQLRHGTSPRTFNVHTVPREVIRTYEKHPRLRRSSEISHFAAIAGMNALYDAGLSEKSENIGVVFAISSGGVRYTTRFFQDVVKTGASTASPLLFPETVFNAPASHLAALLGIDGLSYTLVGDSMIGLSALSFGADLLATGQVDHCIVVATEEADWILCEAFRRSRYFTQALETRPFGAADRRGTVFSEGAGAVVLSREGSVKLTKIHPGVPFFRKKQVEASLCTVLKELGTTPEVIFSNANGTWMDDAEKAALDAVWPEVPIVAAKASLGESVGAGALQQVVLAVQAVREGRFHTAGISAIGYNTLAAGAILEKNLDLHDLSHP